MMMAGRVSATVVRRSLCTGSTAFPLPAGGGWGESDRHDGWRVGNWAGCERWPGHTLHEPTSLAELQEVVRAGESVRVRRLGLEPWSTGRPR